MNNIVYVQKDDYSIAEWLQCLSREEIEEVIRAYREIIHQAKEENWTDVQRCHAMEDQENKFEKFYSEKYSLVMH